MANFYGGIIKICSNIYSKELTAPPLFAPAEISSEAEFPPPPPPRTSGRPKIFSPPTIMTATILIFFILASFGVFSKYDDGADYIWHNVHLLSS